jgi:hypothetical protein
MKTITQILRRLLRNTVGNGEIVGAIALVATVVTLGAVAVRALGAAQGTKAAAQAGQIQGL